MIKHFLPVIFAIFSCIQFSFAQKSPVLPQNSVPVTNPAKKMPEVIIYSADFCGYCTRAKELFDKKKVAYKIIDVKNNKKLIDEMEQKTGKRTIPQILINGKYIGGYMSLVSANMTGELDELLGLNEDATQTASPECSS